MTTGRGRLTCANPFRISARSLLNPGRLRPRARDQGHEGQKLAQVAQDASPRLQARAPQGRGLHHQQDQPALQSQAGLTPSPMSAPKAVIWDVGNVIVRWNPRTLYSQVFSDPVVCVRFLFVVCTMGWHAVTDCGVTFADNCAELSARHPHYAREIGYWQSRWWDMFSGAIPETEAAIEALHARGVPQYVLSNMSHETFDGTFAMSPAFGRIADQVISGREGVMKPDAAIFRKAA